MSAATRPSANTGPANPSLGTQPAWAEQNRAHLVREFALLRRRLGDESAEALREDWPSVAMDSPPAIDVLAETFGLSRFECELLLLLAGLEMESELSELCAQLAPQPRRGLVTFGLGMSVLSEPHWSALAPTAPLRQFRLIEMESGPGFTSAPLRIDERILHYLAGVNRIDPRLDRILRPKDEPRFLTEEHRRVTAQIAAHIAAPDKTTRGALQPGGILQLFGDDPAAQEDIAAWVAHRSGRRLFVLRMEDIPTDLDQFIALWTREAMLLPAYLLLDWGSDTPTAPARQLANLLPGPRIIASRRPAEIPRHAEQFVMQYEVNKAGPAEQRRIWRAALGAAAEDINEAIDRVASEFRLGAETIHALAASHALAEFVGVRETNEDSSHLWNICRALARPHLDSLAQRIVPHASWSDLVLPPLQKQMLQQLASQSRNRMTVYESWGFAERGRRGLGLTALFSGPSGTGKTLAAEVLAAELQLDLYRIDLSAVVSKYIGETEKNLRQVFDAAEAGGVLLLFDEADAIFGKRAEVKDSHDRYANIEVGYLLQRMESFQGLAILTTNFKSSLDRAFQRRLRFTVDFPFPGAGEREAIWQRILPPQAPTEGLNLALLANLNMSGGSIRNIALNAAFMAADARSPVRMSHIFEATQLEAAKIERPISEVETRGWNQSQASDARASGAPGQTGGRP
jgi:ATPase family associated with various cellular activities (AAA)